MNKSQRLNILHLEDEPDFAELVRSLLEQSGVDADIRRVGDRAAFAQALEGGGFDLIISDYHLPSFTGVEAMAMARKKFPHTPFILVSGTIGEQAAIESLKAGATDYVLKQQPDRLPSAVRRAVLEASERVKLRDAEDELRQSEEKYRLLFDGNPNPMWVFDLETLKFLEVNEATIQHYGYSREEFLAMTIMDLRPPEKNPQPKVAVGSTGGSLVWRHRRKDGHLLDVEVVWSPMAFGNRFAALAMATDVTERRQVEHRNTIFSELSHRLSSVTTAPEAAMIICEAADALFKWDDFALDLYFAERDEVFSLLNITVVDGQRVEIPPALQPKTANALIRRVVERGAELLSPAEAREHSAATMLAPVLKGSHVIGVLFIQNHSPGTYSQSDLEVLQTLADQCSGALERVRAEGRLRQTEQRFRDLFENSPDAILVEDLTGKILDVNQAGCVLHGLTRGQLIGKNAVEDLLPADHREDARRNFQKLAAGKLSWLEGETVTPDGRVIPVEVRAGRMEYNGIPALLLHVRDITQRRSAESALQSSEMLFRSVWENSVDGMRLTDENGVTIAVNNAYCKLVGMEASALEGQPFTVVYAASENPFEMIRRHREHFLHRTTEQKSERQYTLHNAQTVMLEIMHSFVEVHIRSPLVLSLFRNVTAQRRLEEQFRQSQKMEAIGQLAGGVAHDFNNILTVIHGHASLLGMSKLDEAGARSASQITQAAERAAALTRQLLAFSRRQIIQPRQLDLNKTVGNMSDMLGRLLGEDVSLQLNYSQTPATVEADAGMMEQVLLNLAVNARDAMPRGGQLGIRIAIVEVNEAHVQRQPEARVGRFVCLSKSDTGCGIPAENLSRIFEPFFTTKEVGKGTGLGLATVYGIVKQHQGWIEVESVIGKGTTFRVYIPHIVAAETETEKPTTRITVRGGTEAILLVEDERPVRELVTRLLQKHGYKVWQAASGNDALGVWKEQKKEISLLLTDLVMPGNMNGHELAEKLRAERPGLKVIFTSGYSADIVGKNFKLEPDLNFLQKPYQPDTLALMVRRCLDGKAN
jgi:PAS domain S-box-containing protein